MSDERDTPPAQPAAHAATRWDAADELSDDDLEAVIGGLARVAVPQAAGAA